MIRELIVGILSLCMALWAIDQMPSGIFRKAALFTVGACMALWVATLAAAEPLMIETSVEGQYIRCGNFKYNAENATYKISDCPALAALVSPTPTPPPQTPVPTAAPTAVPTQTPVPGTCDVNFTLDAPSNSLWIDRVFTPGVEVTICGTVPVGESAYNGFLTLSTVNHSNGSCNVYATSWTSPAGVKRDIADSVQPGDIRAFEVGKWTMTLKLNPSGQCATNPGIKVILWW